MTFQKKALLSPLVGQSAEVCSEPMVLPLDGFTSWNGLKHYLSFSRGALRNYELAGRFPKRIHLSQRCAVWLNRELHRYFKDPVNYRAEEQSSV